MKTEKELLIYLASLIVTGELLSYIKQYASDIGAEYINEELMLMNLQMRELWYLTEYEYVN